MFQQGVDPNLLAGDLATALKFYGLNIRLPFIYSLKTHTHTQGQSTENKIETIPFPTTDSALGRQASWHRKVETHPPTRFKPRFL